jgi:glucose-1-phosphate cytidylyltransferase
VTRHAQPPENWTVHLIDTGQDTNTGGRVKRVAEWVSDGPFFLTYGDGVSDVDLAELLRFHRSTGRIATVTAVRPPARFGGLVFDGDLVAEFTEKPQTGEGWINGGFFVFEAGALDYIHEDDVLEREPLENLANDGQLRAYRHTGFWDCMDTYKDAVLLNDLWEAGRAPWKESA